MLGAFFFNLYFQRKITAPCSFSIHHTCVAKVEFQRSVFFFIFPSKIQRGRIDSPHTALPKGWARRKAEAKLPHSTWFELLRRDTSASLFPHGHAVTQNPPHRESACVSTPDLKFSRPSDPGSQGPWQLGLCEGAR